MRAFDRLAKPKRKAPAPLLPVLRIDTWPMVWQCAHRSLMPGRRGPGIPYVALARMKGDGFDFLLREGLDKIGWTYAEAEAFAVGNLEPLRKPWKVVHSDESTERPLLAGIRGGPHSASMLLDPTVMAQAHALFDAQMLLVAVPSLRELYITDASPSADHVVFDAFEEWALRHFEKADKADQISPRAFLVRDGVVDGIFKQPDA